MRGEKGEKEMCKEEKKEEKKKRTDEQAKAESIRENMKKPAWRQQRGYEVHKSRAMEMGVNAKARQSFFFFILYGMVGEKEEGSQTQTALKTLASLHFCSFPFVSDPHLSLLHSLSARTAGKDV